MTSRERLTAAIRREPVDRVPVSLYEFHDFGGSWAADEPSYCPLLELQSSLGDSFVFADFGSGFLGDPNAQRTTEDRRAGQSVETVSLLHTPRGTLRSISRRDPGVATTWTVKHFVESAEDARAFLSLDVRYEAPRLDSLRELERRVGDSGILNFSVGDPLGNVVGLWDFQRFVLCCYEDLGLVEAMLDRASEYLERCVEFINRSFSGVCVRFWGPEYCGAPLMDPRRFFRRLVVDRLVPLVSSVRAAGNFAVIHCHGRLDGILEMILEIGADLLEPLELLPMSTADLGMRELRRRVGDRMCLGGGMQALDLDGGTPELVAKRVRSVIDEAGTRGTILLPTSAPLQVPLPPAVVSNYRALFETAASLRP